MSTLLRRRTTKEKGNSMISRALTTVTLLTVMLVVGLVAMAALASAGEIKSFTSETSDTQAGGHPNLLQHFQFTGSQEFLEGTGDARTITTHAPTGVIGNPHAIPTCTLLAFSNGECPPASQVGLAGSNAGIGGFLWAPVYNMQTKPGQAGLLAFVVQSGGTLQFLELSARTESDYGLDSISTPIYHLFPPTEIAVELWGVPADPVHDSWRFEPPVVTDCPTVCFPPVVGATAEVPPEPFLSNPTTCGVSLNSGLDIDFYDRTTASAVSAYSPTTGCDQLAFNPSLTVKPTTSESDSAAGLDADLVVPQVANPFTPSPSEIRSARVTLPVGFSLNPNASDGKTDCSDAESAIGTRGPATCPDFSKVGTLSIDSSALPDPIPGAIYLGEPKPGDPYRVILTADGFGTHIKLPASAKVNSATGQVEMSLENLPQSPLTEFNLHFFGSDRGLLATPTQCGSYPVSAEFKPWDDVLLAQSSTSFFEVKTGPGGSPCPNGARPFSPTFSAGSANPTAGRHTPFKVELVRNDGEQNVTGLNVSPPLGFAGTLKGVPYCPESALDRLASGSVTGVVELAEPACPAESRIGTAAAGAGAGSHPLYAPGKVYLAGPYRGAPLSLVVVIPAVSGPYDLGNVAVRVAVNVNPLTARLTAASDPFPQILEGIPLRTRSIRIELDRPDFTVNPTNCEPLSTDATVTGDEGGKAVIASHFQVGNCADLPFEPKLSLQLSGGVRRRGHPAIKAKFTASPGEANTRSVSVTLPKGELLDNSHFRNICTRVAFAAGACPPSAKIGWARVTTPLLDQPLEGNVYLRSSTHELPDIAIDLKGQFDFELPLQVDSVKARLRTTLNAGPDVPIDSFVLSLEGGSKGLLQNTKTLCGSAKWATAKMTGQNGAEIDRKTKLQAKCGKGPARRKRHSRGRAG